MFDRWYTGPLAEKLKRPHVQVMFGVQQTGKSTLLQALLPAGKSSAGARGRWSSTKR
jgi:predicted AAA+ superfamily ATPase